MLLLSLLSFVVATSSFAMKRKRLIAQKSNEKIIAKLFDDNTAEVSCTSQRKENEIILFKHEVKKLFLNDTGFGPIAFLFEDNTAEFFLINNSGVSRIKYFEDEQVEDIFFTTRKGKHSLFFVVFSGRTSKAFSFNENRDDELKELRRFSSKIKKACFHSNSVSTKALVSFFDGTSALFLFRRDNRKDILREDLCLKKEVVKCLFSSMGKHFFVWFHDGTSALISAIGKNARRVFSRKAVDAAFVSDGYLFVKFDDHKCLVCVLGGGYKKVVSFDEEKNKFTGCLSHPYFHCFKFENNVCRIYDIKKCKLLFEGSVKSIYPSFRSLCVVDTNNVVQAYVAQNYTDTKIIYDKTFNTPVRFGHIVGRQSRGCSREYFVIVVFEDNVIKIFNERTRQTRTVDHFRQMQSKIVKVKIDWQFGQMQVKFVFQNEDYRQVPLETKEEIDLRQAQDKLEREKERRKLEREKERMQRIQIYPARQPRQLSLFPNCCTREPLRQLMQLQSGGVRSISLDEDFGKIDRNHITLVPVTNSQRVGGANNFRSMPRPRMTLSMPQGQHQQQHQRQQQRMQQGFRQYPPMHQRQQQHQHAEVISLSDDEDFPDSTKEKKKIEYVDLTLDDDSVLKKRKRGRRDKDDEYPKKRQKTE